MHKFSFEKLTVWQDSRKLVVSIYRLTKNFPVDERYGITRQLRRASISVASNIAEGTSRVSFKDQAHFSQLSYSSLMEVLNQVILSVDLGFVSEEQVLTLRKKIEEVSNKLNALRSVQLKRIKK